MKFKYPFKETPVLYGEDAVRFEKEIERVDMMSEEERRANREKVRKQVEAFRKRATINI